ncbi:thioredoxin domain-containing protein [Vibrio artabrorum]|uniref:thioredoxin domain-containing protein n=1 Tax=Vibrio artabrorum TaxID=446374 RepID=UPI00354DEFE5
MKRVLPVALGALLGAGLSVGVMQQAVMPDFKAQIIEDTKADMLAHPEFLQKLADAYQAQQSALQQTQASTLILDQLEAVKQGNVVAKTPHAPVTVVEFFDYQCVYCAKLAPFINDLSLDTQVQFIFHETPIFAGRWPMSALAADAGNAVYEVKGMDAYDTYHRALFATGHNEGELTQEDVQMALSKVSLSQEELTLSDDKTEQALSLFQTLGFQGTPALIVMPTVNPTADNIHVIFGADPAKIQQAVDAIKQAL